MKQCPACKTTYTDETLRFCLADGTPLTAVADEEATFVRGSGGNEPAGFPAGADQLRVEISRNAPPPSQFPPVRQPDKSSGSGLKVLLALVVLGVVLLAILGAAGAVYYFSSDGKSTVPSVGSPTPNRSASPIPSVSPSPVDATSELRDQIANLEKLLNEQKKTNQPVNIPLTLPNQPTTTTTARVNSPGDGFLALRTFPSSTTGSRILQIPDGATVSVGGCLNSTKTGNKAGRWCRASYDGYSGWVYDAFLIY